MSAQAESQQLITQPQLQALIEQISLASFRRPFQGRAVINYRLRTTGGRYFLTDHRIEINAHFLTPQTRQYLPGIIKHELVHYHLHLLGLGYRHCDRDFQQLLAQVGGSRYAPDIGLAQRHQRRYLYICTDCGQTYPRVRKMNLRRFRCGRCRGRLALLKKLPN